MTEFLLLCGYLLIAYAEQIFAACLFGGAMTVFALGLGVIAFVFWVFT